MPFVVETHDHIEATFVCKAGDQIGLNVRVWDVSLVTGTEDSPYDVAAAMATLFKVPYQNVLSLQAHYRGVVIYVTRGAVRYGPYKAVDDGIGVITGDRLPKQTCGLISLRCNPVGRAFRGRVYVPFPGEASSDMEGAPNAGYQGALSALGVYFSTQIVVAGPGANYQLDPYMRGHVEAADYLITTSTPRARWATQRRRGDFGRPNVDPLIS